MYRCCCSPMRKLNWSFKQHIHTCFNTYSISPALEYVLWKNPMKRKQKRSLRGITLKNFRYHERRVSCDPELTLPTNNENRLDEGITPPVLHILRNHGYTQRQDCQKGQRGIRQKLIWKQKQFWRRRRRYSWKPRNNQVRYGKEGDPIGSFADKKKIGMFCASMVERSKMGKFL